MAGRVAEKIERERRKGRKQGPHRSRLARENREIQRAQDAVIRELVLEHGRVDVLGKYVLDYELPDHVYDMLEFQDMYQEGMILGWRGSRKTTWCTVTRVISEVLRDPNIRILLVSDAVEQAKTFIRIIKSHLEHNKKLRRIFGDFSSGSSLWTDTGFIVNRRTRHVGEPTVMGAGTGTTMPSRHFDLIIADDLVTEDNSRSEGERRKARDYYYKTLYPTLESPDGKLYVLGTRWHSEDLYAHLAERDFKHSTLRVQVLDEETDRSVWEEKFPTERMHRIRAGAPAAFELQYMCRHGFGLDEIFLEEHFRYYVDLPNEVLKYQGIDLAISQKQRADFFAHVTIALHKHTKEPYLISMRKLKMPFPKQIDFVAQRWYENRDVVMIGCESNQYQDALRQSIAHEYPDVPVKGHWTFKDKTVRANQLAVSLTNKPLWIKYGHHEFLRMMRGFPSLKGSKDVFDAFDLAMLMAHRGRRRRRKKRIGLI